MVADGKVAEGEMPRAAVGIGLCRGYFGFAEGFTPSANKVIPVVVGYRYGPSDGGSPPRDKVFQPERVASSPMVPPKGLLGPG